MALETSRHFRIAYGLVLMNPVAFPLLLTAFNVAGDNVAMLAPMAGPLILAVLALYRAQYVMRNPAALLGAMPSGFSLFLRRFGIGGIYLGALNALLTILGGLWAALFTHDSRSVHYMWLSLYFVAVACTCLIPLLLFEFSRLLGSPRNNS